jgi:hypothetical protein
MLQKPPNARFRKAVRGFYLWIGALVVAGVGPTVAIRLIHTWTLPGRIAGVVIGTVAWAPMIAVIVSIVRAGDEFQRRLHLVALAFAFAGAVILLTLLDWLDTAHFIERPQLKIVWLGCAAIWLVSLLLVKRHYERAS